jgi:3-hydroxymyristoyl/3-hydroxydecanoyl-(acyl carrier protein) dehydratase
MNAPTHGETNVLIPADHPAFAGHFPGNPIVPGVLLLEAALHAIQTGLGKTFMSYQIATAKFLSPVKPGEALQVRYEHQDNAIRFAIFVGERKVASGAFAVQAAVPGQP